MSNYRTLKLLGNSVRLLLLILALLGIALLLLWPSLELHLNRVDNRLIRNYEQRIDNLFYKATSRELTRPKKAAKAYQELLTELNSVHKTDRAYEIKRHALKKYILLLRRNGHYKKSLVWSKKWLAEDQRDLFAATQVGISYSLVKGEEENADTLLTTLYKRFPESKLVADAYADILISKGKLVKGISVLKTNHQLRARQALPTRGWEYFWHSGNGFSAKRSKRAKVNINSPSQDLNNTSTATLGNLMLPLNIPCGVDELRIDLPSKIALSLSNPRLSVIEHGQLTTLHKLNVNSLTLNQMTTHEQVISSKGSDDPFFYWPALKNSIGCDKQLFLVAELSLPYSENLLGLANSEQAESIYQKLLSSNQRDTAAFFKRAKSKHIETTK